MFLLDTSKRFFRVSRDTTEILCQHLGRCQELRKREYMGGREEVQTEKNILMTLRYGLTEYAFLKHKNQVIKCINNNILCKFIVWPSVTEMDAIVTYFNDMGVHEFPGIIGATDGSHVQIETPSENPQAYYIRKRLHSVILQGICKDDMQFIHTIIGWPCRVHDAKVVKTSDVWETGYQKCEYDRFYLLGDAAYPLRVWLFTPYRDTGHLSTQQTYFNKSLSSKRQIIERAFGLFKGRFRRWKYIYNRSIKITCEIIQAACILHIVCI